MMAMVIDRLTLHKKLVDILGSTNVYYQEPPNTGMKYPCILYSFNSIVVDKADNKPYIVTGNWTITHMFKKISDDTIKYDMLDSFLGISFDRRIKTGGVYNDYYTLIQ